MNEPVIEAGGLRKHYGSVVALDGIDLHMSRGEVLAILGPNGEVKTTTGGTACRSGSPGTKFRPGG